MKARDMKNQPLDSVRRAREISTFLGCGESVRAWLQIDAPDSRGRDRDARLF